MPVGVVGRLPESRAVADFLDSTATEPSTLVVEGEPGIGKTTLWLDAVDQAREHGFRVLSARPAEAESVLAYASLADLLGGVESAVWADLPSPQRIAMDRVLLRANADGAATDQRAVGAAFLSVVERLAEESPVLVAIDDLQWLDSPSVHLLGFAVRRFTGRVGVLGTVRADPDSARIASWLQLSRPERTHRMRVRPLSLGGLHEVLSDRLGRSFARPTILRIQEVSGGNPFYALELARAIGDQATSLGSPLPNTLTELVRNRVAGLDTDVYDVLLAVACLAAPTVELVTRATRAEAEHVVAHLEDAEGKGIVAIEGHRLRFTHPLLARGVYTDATPARRRGMHRRLAEIIEEPELKARHGERPGLRLITPCSTTSGGQTSPTPR